LKTIQITRYLTIVGIVLIFLSFIFDVGHPFIECSILKIKKKKGKTMKKIAKVVYSAIGGSVLLLAGMFPIPANAKPAPPCVGVFFDNPSGPGKTLVVVNGCKVAKNVKVFLSTKNTPCLRYERGEFRRFVRRTGTKIIKTEIC
jgi:hypothetical protein